MNDPGCAFCGHVNSGDARVCARCDFPLGEAGDAHAHGRPHEPGHSYGEPGYSAAGPAAAIPSPRFKGAGDVIAPTLAIYRKSVGLILLVSLLTSLPEVLAQYGLLQWLKSAGPGAIPGNFVLVGVGVQVLLMLVRLFSSALLCGSLVYAVMDFQRTGAVSIGDTLLRGLKALPKVFVINLLYAVMVIAGYLLLIVPGVILSLKYALVVPAAVAERLGVGESFSRSSELTDGYKGLIFVTYFLWGLAISVINIIVSMSFVYSGHQDSFGAVFAEAFVSYVLSSSSAVLTVYIFLGLVNERSHGFGEHVFTEPAAGAAR